MKDKGRKLLIVITMVLLIVLVGVGLIMMLSKGSGKENKKKETKEDYRCVDKLCISKVSIEENEGSESVLLVIKNEGTTTIAKQCVNLVAKETSMEFCVNELEADHELSMVFEKSEFIGNDINDFKLEKAKVKEEAPVEENQEVVENQEVYTE